MLRRDLRSRLKGPATHPVVGDHFYTIDWNELGYGANGWNFSEVMCRVEPPY